MESQPLRHQWPDKIQPQVIRQLAKARPVELIQLIIGNNNT